jgi:hypothetical protein
MEQSEINVATMKMIAKETAHETAQEVLRSLGVDVNDPIAVQQDMAALRELRELLTDPEFNADLLHVRRWRKSMENVQSKGILTAVGVLVSGALAALWLGIKSALGN